MSQNVTVRRTKDFDEDLAVVTSAKRADGTTLNMTEAIHRAVQLVADGIRFGWDYGDVPDGEMPSVLRVEVRVRVPR
jgi:hypothetical protein